MLLFTIYRGGNRVRAVNFFFPETSFKATNLHRHVHNLSILLQSQCCFNYIILPQ